MIISATSAVNVDCHNPKNIVVFGIGGLATAVDVAAMTAGQSAISCVRNTIAATVMPPPIPTRCAPVIAFFLTTAFRLGTGVAPSVVAGDATPAPPSSWPSSDPPRAARCSVGGRGGVAIVEPLPLASTSDS
ncbi:MAG: hypothetical protein M3401_00955 [Actinomycetota bacterium]|nr:hypothetical protein [Actinomycetota bacterium]